MMKCLLERCLEIQLKAAARLPRALAHRDVAGRTYTAFLFSFCAGYVVK